MLVFVVEELFREPSEIDFSTRIEGGKLCRELSSEDGSNMNSGMSKKKLVRYIAVWEASVLICWKSPATLI